MNFLTAFWDSLTYQLTSTLGSIAGAILQVLLYLFVAYLCWGFVWDRILSKAGYRGKAFLWRFALLCSPVLAAPLDKFLPIDIYKGLSVISVMSFYFGVVVLAILPWKNKPKTETENTKEPNFNRETVNLKNKIGIHYKETPKK
jgi:hypothetical protein